MMTLWRVFQVKVWFQNRRMKWKRVKGTKLVKDKVDGQMKPIMADTVTSTNAAPSLHTLPDSSLPPLPDHVTSLTAMPDNLSDDGSHTDTS